MASFGWKAKQRKLEAASSSVFDEGNQVEPGDIPDEVDWLNNLPVKKRKIALEDASSKATRLKEEGVTLASQERYREAISKWDEALQLVGNNQQILDMKAQALMELMEFYPAVYNAELAVNTNPLWWVPYQTLGRAQLNIGEVKAAISSFQKAIHINPDSKELWEEDLGWAVKLWKDLLARKQILNKDELSFYVRECMRVGIT